MRGTASGLGTAAPLGRLMPAVYQEDEFTMRLTGALDEVLAPIMAVLDSLVAYVDPLVAPEDFVAWLAGWFDVSLDENWSIDRQRDILAHIVELYRWRGTTSGMRRQLELATGGQVEMTESGGVVASERPNTPLPGDPEPRVDIRILVGDPDSIDLAALEHIVRTCKPAHLEHRIEVLAQ